MLRPGYGLAELCMQSPGATIFKFNFELTVRTDAPELVFLGILDIIVEAESVPFTKYQVRPGPPQIALRTGSSPADSARCRMQSGWGPNLGQLCQS